jgi:copper chaperone CopZ
MCRTPLRAALLAALLVCCTAYAVCAAKVFADDVEGATPRAARTVVAQRSAARTSADNALAAAVKRAVLKIEGMKCEECARTIERALRKIRGVRSASVTRADNKARVAFDPEQTSVAKMIETINKLQGMAPYTARESD